MTFDELSTSTTVGTIVIAEPQTTRERTGGSGLIGQALSFVLIGGFCALIDLGVYQGLRALGMDAAPWVDAARAISFIVGTTTAYFLNRTFTFSGGYRKGFSQAGGFILLYTVTFFVAVGVNRWMLAVLPESSWKTTIGWFVSQATATIINFFMLRWVVFRERNS